MYYAMHNKRRPEATAALDPTADGAPIGEPLWYLVAYRWQVNEDRESWEPEGWWVLDWTEDGILAGPFQTKREATLSR